MREKIMDKYSICTECGSKMPYRTDLEYTHNGVTVKPVKGFRCEKCGEIKFKSNEAKRIEILVQKMRNNE